MIALCVEKISKGILLLILHVWSQAINYSLEIMGLIIVLFAIPMAYRSSGTAGKNRTRVYTFFSIILLGIGAVFFFIEVRKVMKMGGISAPQPGISVEGGLEAHSIPFLNNLHGFVVWSSNRFGNHDIVMLSLPGQKLSRLTTNAHTEYFPRISPDGSRIVFCRSKVPWVSQRNQMLWDIYQLDLKTGEETLVARDGNVPNWSEDGGKIRFQRHGNQFVEYDFATQGERVIFETGKNSSLSTTVLLETPMLSDQRQQIAVTLRGGKRGTFIIDRQAQRKQIGDGCQLNWAPDSSYLYYVDHGGKMANAFYKVDPDSLQSILWFDSPTEYSHEYFPRVSNTGEFLVYGASTGDHEHDRADYEIFIWRIGSPSGDALRLSYHTGNDCWPEIFLRQSEK